jgi:hypothetical protein
MLQPAEALTPGTHYQNFPSQTTDAQAQTNLIFFKPGDIWSLGIFLYKILQTTQNFSEIYEKKFCRYEIQSRPLLHATVDVTA